MTPLTEEGLTDATLGEAIDFVRGINPGAQGTWGWDTGRFIDFRWGSNNIRADWQPGWFEDNCRIFRDDSGIRALAIAEEGSEYECILTRTDDAEVVDYVLNLLVQRHHAKDMEIAFEFSKEADWLREICRNAGLNESTDTGCEWEYDLAAADTAFELPDGYQVRTLDDLPDQDRKALAACVARSFDSTRDLTPVLVNIESNPWFRPDLTAFAISPEGNIAAYCRGTVDPNSGVCGIDPIGTDPDHQRLGLGKAVVRKLFANLAAQGGRYAYIGSAPPPAPGTFLYRSLGPSRVLMACEWKG